MARSFRIAGAIIAVIAFCVIAGLGLAQVPVIPDTPTKPRPDAPLKPKPKPTPGTLASDRVEPGTPAVKEAPGTPPSTPDPEAEISPAGEPIRIRVQNVMAPVTVTDQFGNLMPALQPSLFHLYDNGVEQDIHVDTEFLPISLVIVIEASYRDDAILKQIHKIGSLIEPLITGDSGEAAVVAFDHRIQTIQDFTSDSDKLKASIAKISSGSSSAKMVDAVDEAAIMLRRRPRNRRRIILLVSEQRDKGSAARGRETLIALQLSNITLYSVDINQIARRLTEQPQPARPDPIAPEARNLPMGATTPLAVDQATGRNNSADIVPALQEIYTDAKAIFKRNPIEVFTQGTGGQKFSFLKQQGLEDAIAKIGTEIHSQYLLSYNPKSATLLQGGFHKLEVTVDYPRAKAKTKPGYWLAAVN
jgi:VWFA-related protein